MGTIVGDVEVGLHTTNLRIVGIIDLDGHTERVVGGIDELGETSQCHQRTAELTPVAGRAVAFLAPEHVEHARKRGALSAVVVQAEELEARIVLGAQVALNLIFIAERLQLTAGIKEFPCLRGHAVVAQQVAEHLEVAGFIHARVLRNLIQVGEGTPLSLLMGNDRRVVGR